jgi:rfaE bifunctional protein kinase chain/domain
MKKNMSIEKFKDRKIAVVGDLLADIYIEGRTTKISREFPVPIVNVEKETIKPGGAGNVAMNLVSLGCKNVVLIGFTGYDYEGDILEGIFNEYAIMYSPISDNKLPLYGEAVLTTPIKKKIISKSNEIDQQIVQLDMRPELIEVAKRSIKKHIKREIKNIIHDVDALIISDYGRGTICEETIEMLSSIGKEYKDKLFLDSRSRIHHFSNIGYVFPNRDELKEATKEEEYTSGCTELLEKNEYLAIIAKRDNDGIHYHSKTQSITFDAYTKDIKDTTGAGDSAIAAFTLAIKSGFTEKEALRIANWAGALQCEKYGTETVTKEELIYRSKL